MYTCIVPNCQFTTKNCELSFFEIPSEKDIRQQWIIVLKDLIGNNWVPKDRDTICSRHFLLEDFDGTLRKKRLKSKVIPSVFFNYPDSETLSPIYRKAFNESKTDEERMFPKISPSSNICRLCGLNSHQLIAIFKNDNFDYDISTLIRTYLPIKVSESDALCRYICYECFSALVTWHQIFQNTLKVDERLKLFLKSEAEPTKDGKVHVEMLDANMDIACESSSNHNEIKDKFITDWDNSETVENFSQEENEKFDLLENEPNPHKPMINFRINEPTAIHRDDQNFKHSVTTKIYQCNLCDEICKTTEEFQKHLSAHKLIKSYNCSICGETFNNRKLTELHIRNTHSVSGHGKTIGENTRKNRKTCPFCSKELASSSKLQVHLKTIHCDGSSFICDVCEGRFPSEVELQDHINETNHRSDGITIQCTICGLEFENRNSYRKHVAAKHGEGVQCEMCNMIFKSYEDLQDHEALHPRIRPFKCEHCGKNFKRSADYKKHHVIHTGEMPYVCEVCGKKFNRKSNMLEHRRKHDGDKPFSCDMCGLSFFRLSSMRKHKKLHYIKKSS